MLVIFAIFHIILIIVLSFYCFIFKKSDLDYLYLGYIYIIPLQWTFLNGECLMSYVLKKRQNPRYVAGSNPDNEIKTTFKKHANLVNIASLFQHIFVMINFIIVSNRNQISYLFYIPYIIVIEVYYAGLYFLKGRNFYILQEIVKFTLIIGAIISLIYLKKRIHEIHFKWLGL